LGKLEVAWEKLACWRLCIGVIIGVQHIDGSLQVKYRGLVTPAALTPMPKSMTLDDLERLKRTLAEKIVLRSPPEKFE